MFKYKWYRITTIQRTFAIPLLLFFLFYLIWNVTMIHLKRSELHYFTNWPFLHPLLSLFKANMNYSNMECRILSDECSVFSKKHFLWHNVTSKCIMWCNIKANLRWITFEQLGIKCITGNALLVVHIPYDWNDVQKTLSFVFCWRICNH